MFAGKPIIGLAGGIGAGKSFIAGLFGELGCAVIDADAHVRRAYESQEIRQTLRQWWGDAVFQPDGSIDRAAVARLVFPDAMERLRLEKLVHPFVAELRDREMSEAANRPGTVAFVWDTPLLFEVGLNDRCDAVVFVEAPADLRLHRLIESRRWDRAELIRRENSQWPLDRKREISDYIVQNTADAGEARRRVRDILSRILARASDRAGSS